MTCSKTIWVIKKCVRYLSEMTNVLVATNVFRFCNELNFVWNNLSCWLSFQTIWYFLNGIDVLQMLVMTICFFVWWRKMKQRLHITTCIQKYWLLITRTYCSVPVLDFVIWWHKSYDENGKRFSFKFWWRRRFTFKFHTQTKHQLLFWKTFKSDKRQERNYVCQFSYHFFWTRSTSSETVYPKSV